MAPKVRKSRLWWFTNFNLEFDYNAYMETSSATYIVVGREACPTTGKLHDQGFVYYSAQRGSMEQIARELGSTCKPCNGNLDQNMDYCTKDNRVREFGIKPKQGNRTDLDGLAQRIMSGDITVDEITLENPAMYHQYGRTLNRVEDIILRRMKRTWMTTCDWVVGPTGCGKSHYAFEGFNYEDHYVYPDDNGWWDGYTGQGTVIFNEFRGGIPYSMLLDLIDKWPKTVKRRGREPVPFLARHIIITSVLEPHEVYHNLAENDSMEQLGRRIKLVRLEARDTAGPSSDPLAQKCSEGNIQPQSQTSNDSDDDMWEEPPNSRYCMHEE